MPCRDDYPVKPEDTVAGIKAMLVPLLCEACDLLEQNGLLKKAGKELQKFAEAHELSERERIKKEALNKLTPKERRALGLVL